MRASIIMAVASTLWLWAGLVHAGKLGDMRSETEDSGGSSGSGSGSGSSSSSSSWSDDTMDASDVDGAFSGILLSAYLSNVWRLYARYPYADGHAGLVQMIGDDNNDDEPSGQRLLGTLTLDGAYLGASLGRVGVDAEVIVRRFGLALDFSPHLEIDPLDALTLGSVALMVAPVLRPRWQVYAGLGPNVMIDGRALPTGERTDAAGINGTFRTTVLPVRPLVLRGRFDVGRLGAAPAMLGRATVGAIIGRTELFGGYEARKVGTVRIHGPTAGVRVWF